MTKSSLKQVESLIKSGQLEEAEALLIKIVKICDLTPMQRLTASIQFQWLDKTSEAIRVLGPILNSSELSSASNENLYLQIRRAQLLAFTGASHAAANIFQDVELIVAKRERDFTTDFPQYHRSLADYHINKGNFAKAYEHFVKVTESFEPSDQAARFAQIGICDCLDGLGKSSEAVDAITRFIAQLNDDDQIFKAIALQARGEYYFRLQQWQKAQEDFDQSFTYFGTDNATKDFAYLLKWSGALRIYEGDFKSAELELLKAYDILNHPKNQPHAIIEVLYWLEKLKGDFLSMPNRIALYAHPCRSKFSWTISQLQEPISQTWKIDHTIQAGSYKELVKEVIRRPTLDLVCGMLRLPNQTFQLLGQLETKFLIGVISAGSVGINDWALIDFIYQQQFSEFESSFDRLRALAAQLKKKDFPIVRENNTWHWKQNNWTILLSTNLSYLGPKAWIEAHQPIFNRIDIENFFTVPSRTANNWIKNWLTQGAIKALNSGKKIQYQFLNNTSRHFSP